MKDLLLAPFKSIFKYVVIVAVIYFGYKFYTGGLNTAVNFIYDNITYIISFFIYVVLIVVNKDYLKDNKYSFIYLSLAYFLIALTSEITSNNYFLTMLLIISVFGIAFFFINLASKILYYKNKINKKYVYQFSIIYIFSMLLLNDSIFMFPLINSLMVFILLAYTTFISANFKMNIDTIKLNRTFKEVALYQKKIETKINTFFITLLLSVYAFIVFILTITSFEVITLTVISISFTLFVIFLSKYNKIKSISYTDFKTEIIEDFKSNMKEKVSSKFSQLMNRKDK